MSGISWNICGIPTEERRGEDGSSPALPSPLLSSAKKDSFSAADLVKGIVNVTGNSCFLNSLLQALSVLPPFHSFLRCVVKSGDVCDRLRRDALSSLHAKTGLQATLSAKHADDGSNMHPEEAGVLSRLVDADANATAKHIAVQLLRTLCCLLWPHQSGRRGLTPIVPTVALGQVNDMFDDRAQHDVHELFIQLLACLDDEELQNVQEEEAAAALFLEWTNILINTSTTRHIHTPSPLPTRDGTTRCKSDDTTRCTPLSSRWTSSLLSRTGLCSVTTRAQRQRHFATSSTLLLTTATSSTKHGATHTESLPDGVIGALPGLRPFTESAASNPMRGATASRVLCDACSLPPLDITSAGIAPRISAAGSSFSAPLPSPYIQEAFVALSLSPSNAAVGAGRKYRQTTASGRGRLGGVSLTIEDLLAHSFRDDGISGYTCSNTNCGHINYRYDALSGRVMPFENNARKQSCIAHLPPVLVLQIKRSDFHAGLGFATKASTFVDFDWTLNMYPYTMEGKASPASFVSAGDGYMYDLMSLVQHMGYSSGSGHYVTYRRVPAFMSDPDIVAPQWVRTSDNAVHVVSPSEVLNTEAYLLFYVRRDHRRPCRAQSALLAADGVETVMHAEFRPLLVAHPLALMCSMLRSAGASNALLAKIITRMTGGTTAAAFDSEAQTVIGRFRRLLTDHVSTGLADDDSGVADAVTLVWFPAEYDA